MNNGMYKISYAVPSDGEWSFTLGIDENAYDETIIFHPVYGFPCKHRFKSLWEPHVCSGPAAKLKGYTRVFAPEKVKAPRARACTDAPTPHTATHTHHSHAHTAATHAPQPRTHRSHARTAATHTHHSHAHTAATHAPQPRTRTCTRTCTRTRAHTRSHTSHHP